MKKLKTILQLRYLIVVTILVIIYSIISVRSYKSIYDINDKSFVFTITSIKERLYYYTLTLDGKEKIIGKLKKNNFDYEIGDVVKIEGTLSIPSSNTIPNTYSYKDYLNNKKIHYVLNIEKINKIKEANIFYKIKRKIMQRIDKSRNKKFLYTFVLGTTDFIDENDMDNFRENGVTHLFAVSGMHISFLVFIIFKILSKLRVREIRKYYITFIILLFFAFLNSFSSSVLRSIIFFFLMGINKVKRLKINDINILLVTLIIILLIDNSRIFDIGFILSFTVTFFIMYYSGETNYFKGLLRMSILSFLSTLPIIINMNYEVNLFTIINNLIFVPLVSIILYPLCMFSLFIPSLENICEYFISLLLKINRICIAFKINIIFPKMLMVLIIIYYLVLLLYKFYKKRILLFILVLVLIISYLYPNFDSGTCVYFFDVKQGDSSLIVDKHNNTTILIDTGGIIDYEYLSKNMITFFKSIGIRKIDYLFLTHGDFDHMGETINLVNNFKVEKVIFNCGPYNDLEKELIEVLDKKKIKYYSCIKELNIDKNKLYFLQTKEYDNENDNSNVIYTELDGYKFMFMGDASINAEKEILSKYNLPDIDILKVGHHGSKTSSSKAFIDEINPKYSIISVGKNNRYGHPNKEVLDVLEDSKIYRTDQDGSIMFKIKNNKLQVETCAP